MVLPELEAGDLAELSIFPLPSVALFPGALLPLHVFEPRYRELVKEALAGRRIFAVARLQPGYETDYEGRPPIFDICGVGAIETYTERKDGRFDLGLRGLARVRIVEELPPVRAFRQVRAEPMRELSPDPALVAAWQSKLGTLWRTLAPHLPEPVRDLAALTRDAGTPSAYADRLAAALVADPEATQQLLSEADPSERLRLLTARVQELVDSLTPPSVAKDRALN
ncbi:MAG: peptidase lon domain protein [Polyangiaceae bacterium]|jgi:Lon protease-like protein|nr:peptidase lon domain protein [Polyangiaceae bacterium]